MRTQDAFRERRNAAADGWDLRREAVIIAAGLLVPVAGTDQFHEFHAHPEFRYLSGGSGSGTVLAFHPGEGWTLFGPVASQEDRVWVGDGVSLEELAAFSGIDVVRPVHAFGAWLETHRGDTLALLGNHDIVQHPRAYGVDNWAALEFQVDDALSAHLSELVDESRRAKDAVELANMRDAADASRFGHLAAMRLARAGMTERQLQVEVEVEFFRHGGERTAYGSIVGSGPNSAVLHISPTGRALKSGDLVLIDAAAESEGYAADITRTFPVAPTFSSVQRDLYDLVLAVQASAISRVRPGAEYRDLHMAASAEVAQGLVDLGIMRGSAESLVARDAHALFFPHGLGHMLGLSTHDAGGCLAGRTPSDRFGLKWLRADLPLKENYVVTVEPGIYFIPALLDDPARRQTYADAVDWEKVDGLRGFGGIRIEDDVRVTAGGSEVLSSDIPKARDAIEAIRREALSA